jgi:hypothetical protein
VWIGVGLAAVVVAALVIFMVALASKDDYHYTSPGAQPLSSTTAAYPSYPYSASAPSSTWTPPVASVPPPMVMAPDSYGVSCPIGYHLPNQTGWATSSGRGTDATSCQFAQNVLMAYWNSYSSPSRDSRQITVGGTRPCPEIRANAPVNVQCSGNDYVMTCGAAGSDPWITCIGGNDAKVYLY